MIKPTIQNVVRMLLSFLWLRSVVKVFASWDKKNFIWMSRIFGLNPAMSVIDSCLHITIVIYWTKILKLESFPIREIAVLFSPQIELVISINLFFLLHKHYILCSKPALVIIFNLGITRITLSLCTL